MSSFLPTITSGTSAPAEGGPPVSLFTRFAKWTAYKTGRPVTFLLAVTVVAVWAVTGPVFGFSDTWQLVINTGTTIVTFLMVFLIQNTQNRDATAIQIKLDELLRAVHGAQNRLLDLEDLDEETLERTRAAYREIAQGVRDGVVGNTGSPPLALADEDGHRPTPGG